MTEVAVLVAAYNAVETLPRCLDSLYRQTLPDIEILCVDDCSTDGTLQLLQRRAAADSRIKVWQTPVNSGHAVARNLALEHACAPFVCMVDADDWLSDDALEQAMQTFRDHPHTDSVVLQLMEVSDVEDTKQYDISKVLPTKGSLTGEQAFELSMDQWKLHGLYVIRTSLHRQYPYDATCRLYSDENTTYLHYLHSREVRTCQGIYYYRQHDGSQTHHFSVHRFDRMEANLSLLFTLRKEKTLPSGTLKRFEITRWYNFLGCYRLYLIHEKELTASEKDEMHLRFTTILHTFRPSRLPLRSRWKPGYWLMFSLRAFDLQERAYVFWWENGIKKLF